MNVEVSVQSEVKNVMEAVKETAYRNFVRAVKSGELSVEETQLPGIKKLLNDSVDQTFFNATSALSHLLANIDKRLNEK